MKKYVLYDYRALKNTDGATILLMEDTLEEAITEAEEIGGVIYSYDVDNDGNLINETFEKSIEPK